MSNKFDIAIIGSGIAGTCLAAILARQGKRVIVFEAKSHPRFAIGESMILETSETLRALAELYDVPELAYYSSENYLPLIGYSHGIKRHFSYLHHSSGENQDIQKAFQAVIPKEPHGHELHIYRQDSDYFLASVAISYGATIKQNCPVTDINITDENVQIETHEGPYFADFIVDSGGYKSIIADKFGLRDYSLKTHSRGLFTHMINVPDYHEVAGSKEKFGLPFSVAEGTLHHIFDGGWLWVIPFNNHAKSTNPLCSVGLMLDPRAHPEDAGLTAEQEFFNFVAKYPDMERQFSNAKAVRPWTRSGRIQYGSKRIVGSRFALLGHAAGFIDPLYSKGMYVSLGCVAQLAGPLLECSENYPLKLFEDYEARTLKFVEAHDRLVANSYKSFQDYRLWAVYKVLWLLGSYTELVKLMNCRIQSGHWSEYIAQTKELRLAGGGFAEFAQISGQIDEIIEGVNLESEADVLSAVAGIEKALRSISWMPDAFNKVLDGAKYLPKNKLRWSLLQRKTGFMRDGTFREHFFGAGNVPELVAAFVDEKRRYSTASLMRARR